MRTVPRPCLGAVIVMMEFTMLEWVLQAISARCGFKQLDVHERRVSQCVLLEIQPQTSSAHEDKVSRTFLFASVIFLIPTYYCV